MVTNTASWLTTSLHYAEPWETFLAQAVKPYTDVVLQTGVAECFYFERSWERGPNIRLWFQGNTDVLQTVLKPNLEEHFQSYFEAFPSHLEVPNYPADFPASFKWHPNNSLQFIQVDPACERLGGAHEMRVACRVYQAATVLSLSEIKQRTNDWDVSTACELAMKANLGMMYACGFNLSDAHQFFTWMFESQLASQKAATAVQVGRAAKPPRFALAGVDVPAYLMAQWELFRNSTYKVGGVFRNWMAACANTYLDLELAFHKGSLPRPITKPSASVQMPSATWTYLADFVRMTHNQLGVTGTDELEVFQSMAKALRTAAAFSEGFSRLETA